MNAAGLPAIGSTWNQGNDFDSWAYCWPNMEVTPVIERERSSSWDVTQTFSTRPIMRCQDQQVSDPLQEPARISGSFLKYRRPLEYDKDGNTVRSSSHEPIVGIEVDDVRPTVVIETNMAFVNLATYDSLVNTVNDAPLWGLPARCVLLSQIAWSRQLYGLCNFYYTQRLDFLIDSTTFDFDKIIDKGFMEFDSARFGAGTPAERKNPKNYIRIVDKKGNASAEPLHLDNNGSIEEDPATNVNYRPTVQYYAESNLFQLGIPSVIA
jgi:hypothetical protein